MKQFVREFQSFISRGNVLDLAVAVIIGAAFSSIVNSLVKDVINPILGALVGKPDFTHLFWVLQRPEGYTGPETYEALTKAGASVLGYGAFLTAVVHFLLLALVIFMMIKLVMHAKARLEALVDLDLDLKKPAKVPEDVALLREIRDLLKESKDAQRKPAKPSAKS